MKKIISKILIILIVFLLLFDFVFASQYRCVYAAGPSSEFLVGVGNLASGLVAIVYTLLKALIVGLTYGVQVLVTVTASAYGLNEGKLWSTATLTDPITPIDIFFNKYKMLDINFFDFEGIEEGSFIYSFRLSVAEWYTIMKLIACAILLVILVYVGIRMALSTIADDKAKYKKMLADWVVGLLLIFVLQYIIIFTIYCNDAIVKALESAFSNNEMSKMVSESVVKIGIQGIVDTGILSFASVLVYIFIVFQTIIFLLAYMKRMIKVGFLIMISPLITITYSIDKMGDGKAQALGNWLKEFVYTILIQPFHCIIYLALAQTAIELLSTDLVINVFDSDLLNSSAYNQLAAGVLAIMCLKFVNDGEQIVRKIFGFKDDNSTGMGAGAALGIAAIMNAKKIGGATRKGVNNLKAKGQKLSGAIKKDLGSAPIKFAKIGDKLSKTKIGGAVAEKVNTVGNKITSSKVGERASKVLTTAKGTAQQKKQERDTKKAEKIKKKKDKANKPKGVIRKATSNLGKYVKGRGLSTALGIMGAAMVYSSGGNSAMQAIATGTAIQHGSQEFFGSSGNTMANDNEENHKKMEEYAREQEIDSKIEKDSNGNEIGFSQKAKDAIKAYTVLDRLKEDKKAKAKELEEARKNQDEKRIKELEGELSGIQGDIKDAEEIIEKYDKGGNLKGYKESDFSKWKKKETEKFDKGIETRFRAAMHAPDTKKLDDMKNKIIEKLRQAKLNDKKVGNSKEFATLSVDEEQSISSTAQALMDSISLGVLNKKGFGQEAQKKFITQQLGLEKDGRNFLFGGVNDFFDVTREYENYARQDVIAQNYANVSSYDETGRNIATEELLRKDLSRAKPKTGKSAKES